MNGENKIKSAFILLISPLLLHSLLYKPLSYEQKVGNVASPERVYLFAIQQCDEGPDSLGQVVGLRALV